MHIHVFTKILLKIKIEWQVEQNQNLQKLQLFLEISDNKMSVTEKSSSSDVNNVEKDQPTNGFMVATIILSLICLGLLGYVIFLHVKHRF